MTAPTANDVRDWIIGREISVRVTHATERRLRANILRCNAEDFIDPLDPLSDDDLALLLSACADRGLHAGESDAGVWSDLAGREHPLPRVVRSPWRMRVRFCVRAAVTAWRST